MPGDNPNNWENLRARARLARQRLYRTFGGGRGPGIVGTGPPALPGVEFPKIEIPDNPLGPLGDWIGDTYDNITGAESEEKEKGLELGSKEAEEESRFIEQCFLTHELERLSAFNLNVGKPEGYSHYVSLAGEPWQIINELSTRKDLLDIFNLKPYQMAMLVPKIRLYKVFCAGGKESEVEFPFLANWRADQIESLTREGKSLGGGVGIKDVVVKWLGTTDADVNRTIEVQMTFIAQSSSDLFHEETIDGHKVSVSDMILIRRKTHQAASTKNRIIQDDAFRVKLVLGWATPDVKSREFFPKSTLDAIRKNRIVLDLSLIRHALNFNQDGSVELRVRYVSRLDVIMGLTSADVFQDNQTLPLKKIAAETIKKSRVAKKRKRRLNKALELHKAGSIKEAKAQIDKILSEAGPGGDDILGSSRMEWKQLRDSLENEEASQNLEGFAAGAAGIESSLDVVAKATLDQAKLIEKQQLTKKYNKILDLLHERGYLYYIDVPKETIGIWEGKRQLERQEAIEGFGFEDLGIEYDDPRQLRGDEPAPDTLVNQKERNEKAAQEQEDSWWDSVPSWDPPEIELDPRKWNIFGGDEKQSQPKPAGRTGLQPDHYRIDYFYLGSLVEIAYELAKENHKGKINLQKQQIDEQLAKQENPDADSECAKRSLHEDLFDSLIPIMGPLVIQPRRVAQEDGKAILTPPNDKAKKIIQLIDYPISLKLFLELFNRKIVSKGLSSLPLRLFLNMIFREMVQPIISTEGCIGEGAKSFGVLRVQHISTAAAKKSEPRIVRSGRAKFSNIKKTEFIDPESADGLNRKYFQHQITYIDDASPTYVKFGKDEAEDAKKGIYHFYMALEQGLVKNIDFSRADIPYFIAAQVTGEQNKELKYVREFYNAKITMYGNTIFKPGSKILINPLLPAMGSILSEASPARQLGLGGLYDVVNAEYVINENGFETILDARWTAFPAGKDADSPIIDQIQNVEGKTEKFNKRRIGHGKNKVTVPSDRVRYKKRMEDPD